MSDSLYKSADTGLIDLASAVDPLAGEVVHANFTVLKPTPAIRVYSQLAVAAAWGFFIVTSVLFFPVWLVRRLRGRVPAGGPVQVRLWPLLASLAVLAVAVLFAIGMHDPFGELGKPTTISVGIMLGTLAFAAFALLGGYAAIRTRRLAMNRGAYWHSTLASALHLAVMLYLLAFGIIGLKTWA